MCVSRMHKSPYENRIDKALNNFNDSAKNDFIRRLNFAKNNGVNIVILTGEGEALQNIEFIEWLLTSSETTKFEWIELQTSGNYLTDANLLKLKEFGISTISLSVMDIFDYDNNSRSISKNHPENIEPLNVLCERIKKYHFNLRMSLNIWNVYSEHTVEDVFNEAVKLGVDQITFRKLYTSPENNTNQDKWIFENTSKLDLTPENPSYFFVVDNYIKKNGHFLGVLPFGAKKYSVNGISTVIDDNCMSDMMYRILTQKLNDSDKVEDGSDTYKYLILRPNCKLYTDWSDKGSLLF